MKGKKGNKRKAPVVYYDKSLDKYNDINLFPEKVAKANETLEKYGLPDAYYRKNKKTK